MHVSGCTFMGTDVGLRFKSVRGRGGVVENIYISDIRMINIPTQAISFDLYYGGKSVSEMLADGGPVAMARAEPVTIETPQFKNIFIRDVTLKGAAQAIFLQGLPEMKLENVEISRMLLEAESGITVIDADRVKIDQVRLMTKNETAIEFYNTQNAVVTNVEGNFRSSKSITVHGSECGDIVLKSSVDLTPLTTVGSEVPEGAVRF
jgi:polygalacturonase